MPICLNGEYKLMVQYRVDWNGSLYKKTTYGAFLYSYRNKKWVEDETAYDAFWDGNGTYPSTAYEVKKLIELSQTKPYIPSKHVVYVPLQGEFSVVNVKTGKHYILSCSNQAFYTDDGFGHRTLIPNMYIDYTLGCLKNLIPSYDESEARFFVRGGGFLRMAEGTGTMTNSDTQFFWAGMNYIPNNEKTEDEYLLELERMVHNWYLIGEPNNPNPWANAFIDLLRHSVPVIVPIETPTLFSQDALDDITNDPASFVGKTLSLKEPVHLRFQRMYFDGKQDEYYLPVYTSQTELQKGSASSSVCVSLRDLSNSIENWSKCRGLVVNAFGEKLVLNNAVLQALSDYRQISRISLLRGSVLDVHVDAIVNVANSSLLGGGGVDGAIHRAAGPELLEECRKLNGCKPGQCKITNPHKITWIDCIIHTVGPKPEQEGAPVILDKCYYNSLTLAAQKDCHSIAFPCIATGAYAYPLKGAARVAINSIIRWMEDHSDFLMNVFLCCYTEEEYTVYNEMLYEWESRPVTSDNLFYAHKRRKEFLANRVTIPGLDDPLEKTTKTTNEKGKECIAMEERKYSAFQKLIDTMRENNYDYLKDYQIAIQNINRRASGQPYSLTDHVSALVFSQLSNQRPWKGIQENADKIKSIFREFDPAILTALTPEELQSIVDDLKAIKCGNRQIKKQIFSLQDNISTLKRIAAEHGSIDAYYNATPVDYVIYSLSTGKYKIKQMGVPLVSEYLRNVGIDIIKPDVHVKRILGRLGFTESNPATDAEAFLACKGIAAEYGMPNIEVDAILWQYGANKFFEKCTANPDCNGCKAYPCANCPNK